MKETFYHRGSPLSIAMLADFHDCPFDEIIRSLEARKPDIICIPGDLINEDIPFHSDPVMKSAGYALSFLRACAGAAPSFLSLGNHEWLLCDEDIGLIKETGVTLLDNAWLDYENVRIGGLTSGNVSMYRSFKDNFETLPGRYPAPPYYGKRLNPAPDLDWLDSFEETDSYKILLSHHPEYYPKYLSGRRIDLILSGHAHGGQIRIFGHGVVSPGQGFWPEYTKGLYGSMIVSAGLSNTYKTVPRLGNPVEIVYIQ